MSASKSAARVNFDPTKFLLYVEHAWEFHSTADAIFKPARCAPNENPPAPANKSHATTSASFQAEAATLFLALFFLATTFPLSIRAAAAFGASSLCSAEIPGAHVNWPENGSLAHQPSLERLADPQY